MVHAVPSYRLMMPLDPTAHAVLASATATAYMLAAEVPLSCKRLAAANRQIFVHRCISNGDVGRGGAGCRRVWARLLAGMWVGQIAAK
jgi:hypothetical protein